MITHLEKQNTKMPLLSYVSSLYPDIDLSETRIIACQHILRTQLYLLDELMKKGLKPENLYLIGKSYSTNKDVFDEFNSKGVQISECSNVYNSHLSFDDQFNECLKEFLTQAKISIRQSSSKLILIDCGGALISLAQTIFTHSSNQIVAIEQTSSGYEILKEKPLLLPVINVARSWAKQFEAPFLADTVIQKIDSYFFESGLINPEILVIGQGVVGHTISNVLSEKYSVTTYDLITEKSVLGTDFEKHLKDFDVIIGASGKTSVTEDHLHLLKPGAHLISVSSSDREFPSVKLRCLVPISYEPHINVSIDNVHLVNSGFPINFDGGNKSLPEEKVQLVVAIMLASIYEAQQNQMANGFNDLDLNLQKQIVNEFNNIIETARDENF